MCCNVLHCAALCCSVLQNAHLFCEAKGAAPHQIDVIRARGVFSVVCVFIILQCLSVYGSALQCIHSCVADAMSQTVPVVCVFSSELQCIAVCCSVFIRVLQMHVPKLLASCVYSLVSCSVPQCVALVCATMCCTGMFQCTAMCCNSMLQCTATCCTGMLHCTALCCSSMLQCTATCCTSMLQCTAMCCAGVLQCTAMCCSVPQCVAVYRNVLQCTAKCCSDTCTLPGGVSQVISIAAQDVATSPLDRARQQRK